MRLFVRHPGLHRTYVHSVGAADTVLDLKERVRVGQGIPRDQQCLVFAGHALADGRSLRDCGIYPEAMVFLGLIIRCGPSTPSDEERRVGVCVEQVRRWLLDDGVPRGARVPASTQVVSLAPPVVHRAEADARRSTTEATGSTVASNPAAAGTPGSVATLTRAATSSGIEAADMLREAVAVPVGDESDDARL